MADGFSILDDATDWPAPDMAILRQHRRAAPTLPLSVFGAEWSPWIVAVAHAASAPPDYVAATLLAVASALVGNARWAQCGAGWREPPHVWIGVVGESGSSKTPAAAVLLRDVVAELERRMGDGFADRHAKWKADAELHRVATETWQKEVKGKAAGQPPPMPPAAMAPEPQAPRLVQSDVTIERMATLLANAAPKGVLVYRDELAGFLKGMDSYSDAARPFWLEAWNGGRYRVERQKLPEPIVIERLAVAIFGGIQPERLAELMGTPDDGLLARFAWVWPEPVQFNLSSVAPGVDWAIGRLDRLRCLALLPPATDDAGAMPQPRFVQLASDALPLMTEFGRDMETQQQEAGGLLRSAYGKARGLALRLSLVLQYLAWCGDPADHPEPAQISAATFARAAQLVAEYMMPMAQRVYGDADATPDDRNAATLAKHIMRHRPASLSVRELCRKRLSGMNDAKTIHAAAALLVEAGWLAAMAKSDGPGRPPTIYPVNPALLVKP